MILLKESDPSFCVIDNIPCWNPKFHKEILKTLSKMGWTSHTNMDDGCCNILKPSSDHSKLWIRKTCHQWKILRIRSHVHHSISNELWFEPYYMVYFGEMMIVKICLQMFSHRTEYRMEWNNDWQKEMLNVELVFKLSLPTEMCILVQQMLTG